MKIVILDGYTLNPGDLNWEKITTLGETTIYDRTATQQIVERAKGAEIILTNKVIISSKTIEQLPELRYIGVTATGYNIIDIEKAKKKGITVTNAPQYGTYSTAQHAFALLLELTNHVGLHSNSVHDGDWIKSKDFCYWKTPLIELSGKTLGIVGLGKIGSQVARIALAFGMKIIAFHKYPERDQMQGVKFTSIEEVFSQSDFISLHCPLTSANHGFVDSTLLNKMKPSAFLINTSRGPLIKEEDLAQHLNEGKIAGAALDVLTSEPPINDNPLLTAKNCLITPHIAWASKEARQRLLTIVAENLQAFLNGERLNVIC